MIRSTLCGKLQALETGFGARNAKLQQMETQSVNENEPRLDDQNGIGQTWIWDDRDVRQKWLCKTQEGVPSSLEGAWGAGNAIASEGIVLQNRRHGILR